jgi:membrane-bound lytic murein transglycosylase D
MRPTTRILSPILVLLVASPVASRAAAQALAPASMPEPRLVSSGLELAEPAPLAERTLEGEYFAGPADAPDDTTLAEEIETESAEIEDVRRAEEASELREGKLAGAPARGGRIELLPELDLDLEQLQAAYDIPIDVNDAVVGYIRFFQSRSARAHFVKWLGRSHRYVERYREILRAEGLPEDTVYLAMIESGFGNFAYSRAKASGPWQFIAPTGKRFGLQQDFWVDERRDPEKAARAAARYLKELYRQTGDWRLAWAGYNAGVGRIYKARKLGYEDYWDMAATSGKTVLHPETKGYVPKLMAAAIISKHREAFGFAPEEITPLAWREYSVVTIRSATLLSVIARAAEVSERELIELNPELRRASTPPRPYPLKIPVARAETFARNWPAIERKVRLTFAGHVVKRGDTLSAIALRHGVPVQGIMEMNGLKSPSLLRPGQELIIPKPAGEGTASAPAHRVETAGRAPEPARRAEAARPKGATVTAASRADRSRTKHRVQAGDTLWSISRRFGVELDDLCRWNGIENPNRHTLQVGAQLVVYTERS